MDLRFIRPRNFTTIPISISAENFVRQLAGWGREGRRVGGEAGSVGGGGGGERG